MEWAHDFDIWGVFGKVGKGRLNSLSITGNSATVVSSTLGSTFCGLVACLQQELLSYFSFSLVFALDRDHFAQNFVFLEMNLFSVLH